MLSYYTLRGLVSKRFALGIAGWLAFSACLILDGCLIQPRAFLRLAEAGLGLGAVAMLWLTLFWVRLWGSWGSAAASTPEVAFSVRAIRTVLVITVVSAGWVCLGFLAVTGNHGKSGGLNRLRGRGERDRWYINR